MISLTKYILKMGKTIYLFLTKDIFTKIERKKSKGGFELHGAGACVPSSLWNLSTRFYKSFAYKKNGCVSKTHTLSI